MSSQGSPGKTAPKLLHDLLRYDPTKTFANYNVLTDLPPPLDENQPAPQVSKDSCLHEFVTKVGQSALPAQDDRPGKSSVYKVAAVCKKCRVHVDLVVDYRGSNGWNLCPNADFPLHHFRTIKAPPPQDVVGKPLRYRFECSAQGCSAILDFSYGAPTVSDTDLTLLTDEVALHRRYEATINYDPERKGVKRATPVDALYRLRRYINDSLEKDTARRQFPAINKRFMEAFGDECNELLQRLGFKYANLEGPTWILPSPGLPVDSLTTNPARDALEDYSIELQCVIDRLCAVQGFSDPAGSKPAWRGSFEDFARALALQGYETYAETNVWKTRSQTAASGDPIIYASLGALRDFSDALMIFAYDRQTACNPKSTPYYFDCLQAIANDRQTEALQMKVASLASQNVIGQKDITAAYKYFDINPAHSNVFNDEFIIGKYLSRRGDTAASGQQYLRMMLERLGHARNSQALLDAASDTVETYSQALAWLGADESQSDDYITALFTVKTNDNPDNVETGRKAVSIIAKERNSEMLNNWLLTGEIKETSMGITAARKHLRIPDETVINEIDQEMLELMFSSARDDKPGTQTDQAIEAVMKARNEQPTAPAHATEDWPVGLRSHGNTCYLNSLLQYYFTIKPLREMVLNFDEYKFDLQSNGGKVERVGGRKVKPYEIEAYRNFVGDLRHLFDRMIKEPGTEVKPEADLVCHAFLKAEDPNATGVSTPAQSQASAGGEDRKDVDMDAPEPEKTADQSIESATAEDRDAPQQPAPAAPNSHSATAEAISQDVPTIPIPALPSKMPPSPPASDKEDSEKAPPLPPRTREPTPAHPKTNFELAQEAARSQQDVTEVMDTILFRLRCAIKSKGMDKEEEQLDDFRDLFHVRIADRTYVDGKDEPITTEQSFYDITLTVPTGPTDIYSELDRVFDLQKLDHAGKQVKQYKTLQLLPPVLQIQIPRNTFDFAEKKFKKVLHPIRLEDTIYLDRYAESDDPSVLERRQQCWGWSKQLRSIQAEKEIIGQTSMDIEGPEALAATGDFLSTLEGLNNGFKSVDMDPIDVQSDLATALSQESEVQRQRLQAIDAQIAELQTKINAQFEGLDKLKYRLQAVFFHRGGAGSGHYWTFIHDFKNDIWRKYNDERVEEVTNVQDIFNADTTIQGTPTYVVYVKDDLKDQYAEAVCRHPEQAPEQDVQMQDVSQSGPKSQMEALDPNLLAEHGVSEKAEGGWDNTAAFATHLESFWGQDPASSSELCIDPALLESPRPQARKLRSLRPKPPPPPPPPARSDTPSPLSQPKASSPPPPPPSDPPLSPTKRMHIPEEPKSPDKKQRRWDVIKHKAAKNFDVLPRHAHEAAALKQEDSKHEKHREATTLKREDSKNEKHKVRFRDRMLK